MSGLTNVIKIAIVGETKGIKEAVNVSNESLDHLAEHAKSKGQKMTAFAKKATAAIFAGGIALAGVAIKAGDELNESQDQLKLAIENTGGSWEEQKGKLEAVAKASEKYGYTAKQTFDALRAGTIATGSATKAIDLLKTAQNLATATGKPLEAAMIATSKASEGNLKPLKQLGIDLPIAAGGAVKTAKAHDLMVAAQNKVKLIEAAVHAGRLKGKAAADQLSKAHYALLSATTKYNVVAKSGDGVMAALNKRLKGAADEGAKSLEGRTKAMKARFQDLVAHLGQKLIPIVNVMIEKFTGLVDFFGRNHAALIALIAAVGLFVAAMVTLTIIDTVKKLTEAWTKAQAALNFVMDANPIALVVIAIAALVAGVILAYQHVTWFHKAVDKAWQILQTGFNWVKSHWPLLVAILAGPIGVAVLLIVKHWTAIKNGFLTAIGAIRHAWDSVVQWIEQQFWHVVDGIRGGVNKIVGFFTGIPGRIKHLAGDLLSMGGRLGGNLLKGLVKGVAGAIGAEADIAKALYNAFAGFVNNHMIDPIKGVKVGAFGHYVHPFSSLPDIPTLHGGGIFQSNTTAREGLALLADDEGIFTPAQMRALGLGLSGRGRGGGDFTQIINLPAGINPAAVVQAQAQYDRRNGRTR